MSRQRLSSYGLDVGGSTVETKVCLEKEDQRRLFNIEVSFCINIRFSGPCRRLLWDCYLFCCCSLFGPNGHCVSIRFY